MSFIAAYFGETIKSGSGIVATADYSGTTSVSGLYGPTGVGGYASGQFQFVSIESYSGTGSSSASAAGAVVNTVQGAGGLKVLGNKPQQGDPCQLYDLGEVKVVAGAALSVGQVIMSDANGRAVPWVENGENVPIGECRVPANQANDICTMFIYPNWNQEEAYSAADALTAAGTNQATSLQLAAEFNHVTTAAASTGVALVQAATAGMVSVVVNDGANSITMYGAQGSSDTIDGTAGSTGVALPAGDRALLISIAAGKWLTVLKTGT